MSSLKRSVSKINSPLPKDLAGECKKASKILNAFIDPIAAEGIDNIIPPDILLKAKGLAIFTVVKAGFLFSGRAGSGIVVARLDDGTWSAPSAIGTGGMGFGGQIGAEITDFVIILNTKAAVKSFSSGGNVTLGGNLSVAAGPLGRNAEAAASASMKSVAAIYSYSKTKGLFAGISIEGSVIMERKDANETFYRRPVTAAELLNGDVPPPPQADILYRALNAKASSHGSSHLPSHVSSHADNFEHDKDSNHHSTSINHSVTTSYLKGTDNFDSNADANDDPAPAYTPSAVPNIQGTAIANNGHGRSSSDNPSLGSHSSTDTRSRAPPPPPPPVSTKPDIVTALYDFSGEQATDLSFKKGDIITVIKKTPSKNDWWTGRCNGSEGSFPANYTI
ncbi:hypothetical protein BGX21_005036 [Mortierella sp. AD011]|nr:hypothetical protein BGX20_005004 [Mortierella sp. AD010]KAF9371698.1 hypothetical protein BGX21_005036 [Mortierella sp. AD011]